MIKQKLKKILSLVLVFAITFPIVSTALSNFAFAAVIKDVYTVVYPRWNDLCLPTMKSIKQHL